MKILEIAKNTWHEVTIEEISPKDFKALTPRRYFFNWKKAADRAVVYKLRIIGNSDIKGLMALVDFPTECRIEIRLITASKENAVRKKEKGKKQKQFDGIPGTLIAFAGKQAITKHGKQACVSLIPKTELRNTILENMG